MSEAERSDSPEDIETAVDAATEAVQVQSQRLDELSPADAGGDPIEISQLMDVPVRVTVEVGQAQVSLAELVRMRPGSLIPLDREAHEPADVLVNGKVVARGEIVTLEGRYGVRICSVVNEESAAG